MSLTNSNHVALADTLCLRATIDPAAGFFSKLVQTVTLWNTRMKQRNAMRRMTADQLDDVGLTSSQITTETRKPFWRA